MGRTACALRQRKARPTGPLAAHTPRSGADLRTGAAPALRWEGALRPLLAPPTAPGGAGGRPLPLKSAFGAGGRSAAESPRPGAAQRLAAPPPPGPHPPAPIPLRWTLSRAGGRGSRAPPLPPGAPAHPRLPQGGRGGHLLRVPGASRDSRPGAARPRAGLLLAPGASSRRPASITAGAPGRKAGPEMRGLLKGQRAFSGLRLPASGSTQALRATSESLRAKEHALGSILLLFFYRLGP